MLNQLETLGSTARTELDQLTTGDELTAWNSKYIGRKGELTQMLRQVSNLSPEERPAFGQRANQIKKQLEAAFEDRNTAIKSAELEESMAAGALDVTLPGRPVSRGRLHPSTQTLRRIYEIWADMGFQVYRSRDVETDEMNFELLNFPPHHPARPRAGTRRRAPGRRRPTGR